MMKRIVLHPKFAPPGRIRAWVGAAGYSATPALSWSLDGVAVQPAAIRPLESARPASMPADDWFRVLLVSCHYRPQDKSKLIGTLPHRIPAASRPDMSILMGDQVYLRVLRDRWGAPG